MEILQVANIDYAGLANNHTLDFCEEGLRDTVRAVKAAGVRCAGAAEEGEDPGNPAILSLSGRLQVHVYSASDHPSDWAQVPSFNLIDYTPASRARLKKQLTRSAPTAPALKIFSVHWGYNYAWRPPPEIQDLAHFLIDECGVDVIHGHSSHHIQGIEVYQGKPILYGCGDFVDDYAVVKEYRNDLSAVWNLVVEEQSEARLHPIRVEVFPTRIQHFQAELLAPSDPDHVWVREKLIELSAHFDSPLNAGSGDRAQVTMDLQAQKLHAG